VPVEFDTKHLHYNKTTPSCPDKPNISVLRKKEVMRFIKATHDILIQLCHKRVGSLHKQHCTTAHYKTLRDKTTDPFYIFGPVVF
jgi:hypothetical protein